MAKNPGQGRCVYCLKWVQERNWDHVFPQAWYPDSTPANCAKWKVPSCIECNQQYNGIEDNLRIPLALALGLNPRDSDDEVFYERARRSISSASAETDKDRRAREQQRCKLENALNGQVPAEKVYPGFGPSNGVPRDVQEAIPLQRLDRFAEKIVRGIVYLEEDGRFIEPPCEVHSYAPSRDEALDRQVSVGLMSQLPPGIVINRVDTNGNGHSTHFRIVIWRKLIIYSIIGCRGIEDRHLQF